MRIDADHPALPGHFPGHPVVPGVVLLDTVTAALERHEARAVRVTGFPVVKFLVPLLPERDFEIRIAAKADGQAAFDVVAGSATLASGTVVYD